MSMCRVRMQTVEEAGRAQYQSDIGNLTGQRNLVIDDEVMVAKKRGKKIEDHGIETEEISTWPIHVTLVLFVLFIVHYLFR